MHVAPPVQASDRHSSRLASEGDGTRPAVSAAAYRSQFCRMSDLIHSPGQSTLVPVLVCRRDPARLAPISRRNTAVAANAPIHALRHDQRDRTEYEPWPASDPTRRPANNLTHQVPADTSTELVSPSPRPSKTRNLHRPSPQPLGFVLWAVLVRRPMPRRVTCDGRHPKTFTIVAVQTSDTVSP